jgi:Fe-S-cluster containining protein
MEVITNRQLIQSIAIEKEAENDAFRSFIKNSDGPAIDLLVQEINAAVEPCIDCTSCAACCKTLMINVKPQEAERLASHLKISSTHFKARYIEESLQAQMILNKMPCHFLEGGRCTVYEQRFAECREFPHLSRQNFKDRMFGTLIHYAICPIIFNVIEELKIKTGFKEKS